MATAALYVTGLRELRAACRKIGGDMPAELRNELKSAVDVVGADIRRTVPKKSGRAAGSVRPVSGGNTIYLKAGGARVPYYGWLDFGGQLPTHYPNRKKAMAAPGFGPVARAKGAYRPKIKEGRYMYPGIRRNESKLVDACGDAFDNAARKAGLL